MTSPHAETAVILSGGGARAAYQIGALRAVARILGPHARSPFGVITGTSAGAINAAALAANADNWRRGIARALRLWRNIIVSDVYEADLASVAGYGMRWLASVLVGGGGGPAQAASMLDNTPLRGLLERALDLSAVPSRIQAGQLHAFAINATSYTTGHAVSFFDGAPSLVPWRRTRRRGERALITVDHLLGSTAIPFIFPAVRIAEDYYADGSMRHIAPLSPALHLGARRILVVAVGQFAGQRPTAGSSQQPAAYPSFAQIAGHALTSIFLDNLGADLERMLRLNQVLNIVPPDLRPPHSEVAHVDALLLAPSRDLGQMAIAYAEHLPKGARYLLHGLGGTEGPGANLLSYLLFDRHYCRELLALGFADAMMRRDEIAAFLSGDSAAFLPLMPPELLT
jgi:NTE family protein